MLVACAFIIALSSSMHIQNCISLEVSFFSLELDTEGIGLINIPYEILVQNKGYYVQTADGRLFMDISEF